MLPDIGAAKETLDSIAVVVTGDRFENLLAVPKIVSRTG